MRVPQETACGYRYQDAHADTARARGAIGHRMCGRCQKTQGARLRPVGLLRTVGPLESGCELAWRRGEQEFARNEDVYAAVSGLG